MFQAPATPPPPDAGYPTVTIVERIGQPLPKMSTIDVAIGAVGFTSLIIVAAAVAGVVAGALYVWFRSRGPVSIIEARGGKHDLFKV
jgi:hypothetical protein